jgi:hypothetical protein
MNQMTDRSINQIKELHLTTNAAESDQIATNLFDTKPRLLDSMIDTVILC